VAETSNRLASLAVESGLSTAVSPDGRYLVTYPRAHAIDPIPRNLPSLTGTGSPVTIQLHDLVTGQIATHSVYHFLPRDLSFDPAGQNVLVGGSGVLHVFPFQNGKLDVAGVRTEGARIVSKAYEPRVETSASHAYLFAKQANDRVLHAFDLKSGSRRTVELEGLETKDARDKIVAWGLAPGTDEAWTLTRDGKDEWVTAYTVPTRGKATRGVATKLPESDNSHRIARLPGGAGFIAYHFGAVLKYDGTGAKPVKLPMPKSGRRIAQVNSVEPLPDGKRAVALVTDFSTEWLVLYDLEQNKITGRFDLPKDIHSELTVIGDGGRIAIRQHTGNLLLIPTAIME